MLFSSRKISSQNNLFACSLASTSITSYIYVLFACPIHRWNLWLPALLMIYHGLAVLLVQLSRSDIHFSYWDFPYLHTMNSCPAMPMRRKDDGVEKIRFKVDNVPPSRIISALIVRGVVDVAPRSVVDQRQCLGYLYSGHHHQYTLSILASISTCIDRKIGMQQARKQS